MACLLDKSMLSGSIIVAASVIAQRNVGFGAF